jgi:TetR/AcrR family transcriptional regulator, transcriptional repressor for nem operon
VQEAYGRHPPIREACDAGISDHAVSLEADIAKAMSKYKINADWSAASLALYTQAVIQGAFILAKAKNGPQLAGGCLDHLRRYMQKLFTRSKQEE